jgi:hypothetical protein
MEFYDGKRERERERERERSDQISSIFWGLDAGGGEQIITMYQIST